MLSDYPAHDGLLAMEIVMITIAVVSTASRFWSRALGEQCGWDDWLCLMALTCSLVVLPLAINLGAGGLGVPASEVSPEKLVTFLRNFFIAAVMDSVGLGFTKLSALAFYARIFGRPGRYGMLHWTVPFCIVIFLVVAWILAMFFFTMFRCSPIQNSWDITGHSKCAISVNVYFVIAGVCNVFVDIFVLLLPIPQILRLTLSRRKKALIIILLVSSYSTPIISLGRTIVSATQWDAIRDDFTAGVIPLWYWLIAELPLSIFAISIPGMYQLYMHAQKYGVGSLFTFRDRSLDRKQGRQGSGTSSRDSPPDFSRAAEGKTSSSIRAGSHTNSAKAASTNSSTTMPEDADEAIHVKTEVMLSYGGKQNLR